ncbi:MAG: hypothetical protein JW963_11305 [Anaerolineales bacterium]|nr:hypothetical protein [Anaerolineales bacterium]
MDVRNSRLWLLTGASGAGKTAFCRRLVEEAYQKKWTVAGLLSPAVFENNHKTGILAQDLRTGESRPLARNAFVPTSHALLRNIPAPPASFSFGTWIFHSPTIAWGNQRLAAKTTCDLFIVDEIGPIELLRGEGWIASLDALRQPFYRLGIVVIRPELVETARQLLPIQRIVQPDTKISL